MATIDLIVLGMIKAQPQSAYELQKNVEYRNISWWVKVSTPSIYKKVVQLEKKGYLLGEIVKEGKMPEKTVYHITDQGDQYFLTLMEEASGGMVRLFLDFNAVVMNLNFVSDSKKAELISRMEGGIQELREEIKEKSEERQHVPLTGKTILDQQMRLTEVLTEWITEFRQEYLQQDED